MKGLSSRRRSIYFWLLAVFFVVVTPVLGLYAQGYRLDSRWNVVKTGGLFVRVPIKGAEVFVENRPIFETGFFDRELFLQNLVPGRYRVDIKKDGYQPWSKNLSVFAQSVTKTVPFLLPSRPVLIEVERLLYGPYSTTTGGIRGSSTKQIKNPEYDSVIELFSDKHKFSDRVDSATSSVVTHNMLGLSYSGNEIAVEWLGRVDSAPEILCIYSVCAPSVSIPVSGSVISYADFFPGRDDVVLVAVPTGVYAIEVDGRDGHSRQVVLEKPDLSFRVSDNGDIFIKDGLKYFRVDLFGQGIVTGN